VFGKLGCEKTGAAKRRRGAADPHQLPGVQGGAETPGGVVGQSPSQRICDALALRTASLTPSQSTKRQTFGMKIDPQKGLTKG
jgi:hypothetical protein